MSEAATMSQSTSIASTSRKEWDLCFHCGRHGHEKVDCPSKTEPQSQAGKDASQAFSKEREVRFALFELASIGLFLNSNIESYSIMYMSLQCH